MRAVRVVATAALVLLVGACGNESGTGREPTMTPPSSPGPTSPASPGAHPVEQAKADLVTRLGVDPAQVTVVSSDEVTWRDGSLGCPQPGKYYTQALVNGTRIVLEAGGEQYHYHSGGSRAPFLCENPQPPLGG